MAKRFGGTALEDQEYVLVLDRELRAYLTQLIESPRTTWLTLLELVSHLYGDEGSVYRDVAVLLVPGLISGGSRPTMDVEPETIDGWVSQLLSLTDEEIRRRAIGFFETNLGPYVPMRSIDEPAAP